MPGQRQPPPDRPRAAVNFQVSDTEPFLEFINRLVALQDRLDRGQITSVREAADELGRILALNEGHRL